MILHALAHYQPPEAIPEGYAKKKVGFVLRVRSDLWGCELIPQYIQQIDVHGTLTNRWDAVEQIVPNMTRSNNPPPLLACDNAAFVLGLPKQVPDNASDRATKEIREKEVAERKREDFHVLLSEWAEASNDADAKKYMEWYLAGSPGLSTIAEQLTDRELKRLSVDLIGLQIDDGALLHAKPSAEEFWAKKISPSADGTSDRCMVCGHWKPVVNTLPQSIAGVLVPDTTTAQVALLSGNFTSAQRGATGSGLKSAPICAQCSIKVVQSFNALASDKDHRWGDRNDRTATIWWTKENKSEGIFGLLNDPDPARIQNMYMSLDRPFLRRPRGYDADRFYALTFSGSVARLAIRSWIDVPLVEVQDNIMFWFANTSTASQDSPQPSLAALAKCCGQLVMSQGRWKEEPANGTFDALLSTALMGTKVLNSILLQALARARAEIHYVNSNDALLRSIARRRYHDRFGLIRLVLNQSRLKENPMTQYLDENRSDPAYLSGRLFAMRESLQYQALGEINSSIVDRYFARASENPVSVEHVLTALEKQHLKTLARKRGKGAFVRMDQRISDLHDRLGVSPGRLTALESAEWIAGYYQQRQHDFRQIQAAKEARNIQSTSITKE